VLIFEHHFLASFTQIQLAVHLHHPTQRKLPAHLRLRIHRWGSSDHHPELGNREVTPSSCRGPGQLPRRKEHVTQMISLQRPLHVCGIVHRRKKSTCLRLSSVSIPRMQTANCLLHSGVPISPFESPPQRDLNAN
jgi:hypothetical protein